MTDATTTTTDLVFTTAVKAEEDKALTAFTLDGEEMQAHKPKDSVALWIRKILVDENDLNAVVGGYEKFVHYLFPPATRARLISRLEDADDDFDINDMNELMEKLFMSWGVIDKDGNAVDIAPKPARKRVPQR